LTIVDDCSRATWIHLLAYKSNALPLLKAFVAFVATQFGTVVKIIKSDNGLEFKDTSALEFYKANGIIHQTSCIDTPQQNGIVERNINVFYKLLDLLCCNLNCPSSIGERLSLLPHI